MNFETKTVLIASNFLQFLFYGNFYLHGKLLLGTETFTESAMWLYWLHQIPTFLVLWMFGENTVKKSDARLQSLQI